MVLNRYTRNGRTIGRQHKRNNQRRTGSMQTARNAYAQALSEMLGKEENQQ